MPTLFVASPPSAKIPYLVLDASFLVLVTVALPIAIVTALAMQTPKRGQR